MEANPFYLQIGNRLIELRTARGLNQKEAASALGIKDRTYQNYEYGFRKPNTANTKKIMDHYGCKYMWLIKGEGGQSPDRPQEKPDASSLYSNNVVYLDQANRILNEAIADAGVDLNDAQKTALRKIIQEEIDSAAIKAGDKAKEIINVFKKES